MDATNASHNPFEESGNEMLNLVHFTNLEHFLEFRQEEGLLNAVRKWPIFEKSFEQSYCQCSIFSKEEHRASQELFIELRASLDFVKRNDNVFEEDNMLISQRDRKSADNAG